MSDNKMVNDLGFQAILDQCQKVYPQMNCETFGTVVPYRLGGKDPLDRVVVFSSDEQIPHWHYVTCGFSELYEKESENKELSGWGFELTFRLKREGDEKPPIWPINLLQNLARYVFKSGNVFAAGEHMDCNGPIALEQDTKLVALGFDTDPQLGSMDTPNGHVDFIEIIALTMDELDAMMLWNGKSFLQLYRTIDPLGIAVLERDSFLNKPAFKATLDAGIEQDGSSTGFLYVDDVTFDVLDHNGIPVAVISMGAGYVTKIMRMLKARLSKERKLLLQCPDIQIAFEAREKPGLGKQEDFAILYLPSRTQEELAKVPPHVGQYVMKTMPIVIRVHKTEIRDSNGNIVSVIE